MAFIPLEGLKQRWNRHDGSREAFIPLEETTLPRAEAVPSVNGLYPA
jgi:hypothetical protein